MKANKIYGYAELTGFTVPDISKLQTNFYPVVNYESFLIQHGVHGKVSYQTIDKTLIKKHYTANYSLDVLGYSGKTYHGKIDSDSFTIELSKIDSGTLGDVLKTELFIPKTITTNNIESIPALNELAHITVENEEVIKTYSEQINISAELQGIIGQYRPSQSIELDLSQNANSQIADVAFTAEVLHSQEIDNPIKAKYHNKIETFTENTRLHATFEIKVRKRHEVKNALIVDTIKFSNIEFNYGTKEFDSNINKHTNNENTTISFKVTNSTVNFMAHASATTKDKIESSFLLNWNWGT